MPQDRIEARNHDRPNHGVCDFGIEDLPQLRLRLRCERRQFHVGQPKRSRRLIDETGRETGEPDVRRGQDRASKLGPLQIGILKLGPLQVRALKPGAPQIRALKLRSS